MFRDGFTHGLCPNTRGCVQASINGTQHIHQQHGEGDAIGIAAKDTDYVGEQAGTGAEDQLAARRRAPGNRVGGDEEGAEHGAAGEHVEQRAGELRRVVQPEGAGNQGQGADEGDRDVPGDDLALPQPESAEQVAAGHPFPAAPGEVAEDVLVGQQLGDVDIGFAELERGFHRRPWRRPSRRAT